MSLTVRDFQEFWDGFRKVAEADSETPQIDVFQPGHRNRLRSLWDGKKYLGASVVAQIDQPESGNPGGELRVDVVFENPKQHAFHSELIPIIPRLNEILEYDLVVPGLKKNGKDKHKFFVVRPVELEDRSRWPEYHTWLLEHLKDFHGNVLPVVQQVRKGVPSATIIQGIAGRDRARNSSAIPKSKGSAEEPSELPDLDDVVIPSGQSKIVSYDTGLTRGPTGYPSGSERPPKVVGDRARRPSPRSMSLCWSQDQAPLRTLRTSI